MMPSYTKPILTHFDAGRLRMLIAANMIMGCRLGSWLSRLDLLIRSSDIVPAEEIAPDIVTMNSQIRLRDKSDRSMLALTLVFPEEAGQIGDSEHYRVSIVTPLGLAIMGRRIGYEVHGRLCIDKILFQPEAAGEYVT